MEIKTKTTVTTLLICPFCGYEWQPRFERLPKVCPRCKNRLDTERKCKNANNSR